MKKYKDNNHIVLSALILTVWINYQQDTHADEDVHPILDLMFSLLWMCSGNLALFATILSIFYILVMNKCNDDEEVQFFVITLNDYTKGFGSLIPILFLYVSTLCAACGVMVWHFSVYGWRSPAWSGCGALIFTTLVFMFFYSEMVTSFEYTKRSFKYFDRIDKSKTLNPISIFSINCNDLKSKMMDYIKHCGGIEKMGSADDFKFFIRVNLKNKCKSVHIPKLHFLTSRLAG